VIKTDTEERRIAVFKDNKLRLLMTLIGFIRLGADNDPDASWLVPASLTSVDLQAAIDLIRKYEFDPPTYEDGKGPEDMLRSKTATERRAAPRAEFDDDSDGIDRTSDEDKGEYAADGPTVRKPDGTRKKLTRRRREKTPVELDDEEKEARAEARRKKEAEKRRKEKSTMFVHDSDDEDWDTDRENDFYERENEIREFTMAQFKKSMGLTAAEPTSLKKTKKRKADGETGNEGKRKKTPPRKKGPFDDSDSGGEEDAVSSANEPDEQPNNDKKKAPPRRKAGPFDASDSEDGDVVSDGIEADSEEGRKVVEIDSEEEEEGVTDTPLSSKHAAATRNSDGDSIAKPSSTSASKNQDVIMVDEDDEDEDDAPVARRPAARSRTGFVIESDSDE
jgi:replication fork protection complex subunit Tof1/Swi1